MVRSTTICLLGNPLGRLPRSAVTVTLGLEWDVPRRIVYHKVPMRGFRTDAPLAPSYDSHKCIPTSNSNPFNVSSYNSGNSSGVSRLPLRGGNHGNSGHSSGGSRLPSCEGHHGNLDGAQRPSLHPLCNALASARDLSALAPRDLSALAPTRDLSALAPTRDLSAFTPPNL